MTDLGSMVPPLLKSSPYPFHAVPPLHEDQAPDVLIKGKGKPHSYEPKTEDYTKEIAASYTDYPLHDDAEIEGEEDVTCRTQGVRSPYIDTLSYLKQHIDPETTAYQSRYLLIVGKDVCNVWATECTYYREEHTYHCSPVPRELAYDVRGIVLVHPGEVAYHDTVSLRNADGIEIDEHDDVSHVDACRQSLIAYHVDKKHEDELLQVVPASH